MLPQLPDRYSSDDRAGTVFEVLSWIRPDFWEKTLNRSPKKLLACLRRNHWYYAALDGLCHAAIRFRTGTWLAPLWDNLDSLDRSQVAINVQPAAYFRTGVLPNIAKYLLTQSFERRVTKDAMRMRSFSFERFAGRWEKVYRPWPTEASYGILRRIRNASESKVFEALGKGELLGLLGVIGVIAERAAPAVLDEFLKPLTWPSAHDRYQACVPSAWAKAQKAILARKSRAT